MKDYFFICLFMLFCSFQGSSQSLRKCGCQTWREWKMANPNTSGQSRWSRKQSYERYKHDCIVACRQRQFQRR